MKYLTNGVLFIHSWTPSQEIENHWMAQLQTFTAHKRRFNGTFACIFIIIIYFLLRVNCTDSCYMYEHMLHLFRQCNDCNNDPVHWRVEACRRVIREAAVAAHFKWATKGLTDFLNYHNMIFDFRSRCSRSAPADNARCPSWSSP